MDSWSVTHMFVFVTFVSLLYPFLVFSKQEDLKCSSSYLRASHSYRDVVFSGRSSNEVCKVAVISTNPLIRLYKNCITSQQQFSIRKLAKERLVEDTNSGFSWSLYLRDKRDANLKILREIAMLAGNLSGLPWKLAEPVSLTKYTANQNYDLHYDSGFVTQGKKMKRAATFLLYLNSVAQGGETIFPRSINGSHISHKPLRHEKPLLKEICCDEKVLKVVPEARSCLVFFNHLINEQGHGDLNPRSIHGSCPVINGNKWIAQVWLHHEPWGSNVTDFW